MNLSRIANRIFRISRQPRRPVIHQRALEVLPVRNGRKIHGHSTTVIPVPSRPVTWKQAWAQARAYKRVLNSLPKWPTPKQAEEIAKEEALQRAIRRRKIKIRRVRYHSVTHQKRGGETWWNWKMADVIDERVAPKRTRGKRRRRTDAETQKRNLEFYNS